MGARQGEGGVRHHRLRDGDRQGGREVCHPQLSAQEYRGVLSGTNTFEIRSEVLFLLMTIYNGLQLQYFLTQFLGSIGYPICISSLFIDRFSYMAVNLVSYAFVARAIYLLWVVTR